jgi:glucose-1-phosphate adenylyltransferase
VKDSVVFPGVTIEKDVVIEDSIIMSNSIIKTGSRIFCTIVGERTAIGSNVQTGAGEYRESSYNPKVYQSKITVIGSNTYVPDNAFIGCNVVLDNHLLAPDYKTLDIPSGSAVIKGGEVNE